MNLSAKEKKDLEGGQPVPLIVDGTECVLVRRDVYVGTNGLSSYDDSPWTTDKMDAAAAEAADRLDTPDREGELSRRHEIVARIEALRERMASTYGEMPDSTELIREDRSR